MAATYLSASEQTVLAEACAAFSDATQRFRAEAHPQLTNRLAPTIHFSTSGKQFDMPVVVVPNAGSHTAAAVQNRHQGGRWQGTDRPLMLVTYYVSAKLAENLIAARIPFLDTAGNVYLDEPEATVMITGRDKPALRHSNTTSRSTTNKGLRVSFALATQPGLVDQPYRAIAHMSGVALNTVNLAVDDLMARKLLVKKNGARVIADRRKFIRDWATLYPTGLRPKLGARRYASAMDISWWKTAPLKDFNALLGGECAAEALTHENKPVSVTLYAHGGATNALMKAGRLRPDENGDIEIVESFWPQHAEASWDAPAGIVPILLVYADMIASGDSRNHSVADILYDNFLDR